jgi:hypothetical protein
MMKARDLTGQTFNRLTITKPHSTKGFWLANCACGTKDKIVRGSSVISGNTKSCGCMLRENKGRPINRHAKPFIEFDDMLHATIHNVSPIRAFLKSKGVIVTKDSLVFFGGKRFGPYKSPFHALAFALEKTVKGIGE